MQVGQEEEESSARPREQRGRRPAPGRAEKAESATIARRRLEAGVTGISRTKVQMVSFCV